jgi:hypothetical protein
MQVALLAMLTSGALVIGPTSVPIQRPGAVAPAPAPEAAEPAAAQREPTPQPEPAPDPQPLPESAPAPPESSPFGQTDGLGVIEGIVTDVEVSGVPIVGANVQLVCPCLPEPATATTDIEGRFFHEGLPPGTYTVIVERGGRPTRKTISLGVGATQRVALTVSPPTSTAELDRRRIDDQRARTLIATGSVAGAAALFMLIGAAVEANKPECKFDLDDCAAAPRPNVTRGLGIGGAVLAIVGGTLIGVGVHKLRKLRARVELDDRAVALVVGGRF